MKYKTTIREKLTELILPFNQISLNYSLDNSQKYIKLGNELYEAILQQNLPLIRQKLKAGANINYTPENKTPALQVLLNKHRAKKTLHFLLENGANPNLKDSLGRTALHQAISLNMQDLSIKLVQKYKADIHATNNLGQTPLHFCSMYHFSELAQLLIQKGADINKKDNEQKTPLYTAVEHYAIKTIPILLENNADCFIPNKNGVTPYIYAEAIMHSDSYPFTAQIFNKHIKKQLHHIIQTSTESELLALPEQNTNIIRGLIHYRLLSDVRKRLSTDNQIIFYHNLRKHYASPMATAVVKHKPCPHCRMLQHQR